MFVLEVIKDVLAGVGALTLSGGLFAFWLWWKDPQKLELMVAQVGRVLGFLGVRFRQIYVKYSIQGRINQQVREFEEEVKGTTPHGVSIHWVGKNTRRDSFMRGETVVCRMSYEKNPHLNYLHAALLYVNAGFIPGTRMYLNPELRLAVDLVAVSMILTRTGDRGAQYVFYNQVLPKELEAKQETAARYRSLSGIERYGLYSRVFLPEAVDFGMKAEGAPPASVDTLELDQFVNFLEDLHYAAEKRDEMAKLDFSGGLISLGIIYVGIPSKLSLEGFRPYVNRIRICRRQGAETIYLIARGQLRLSLHKITSQAEKEGLCKLEHACEFNCAVPEGGKVRAAVWRLRVLPTIDLGP